MMRDAFARAAKAIALGEEPVEPHTQALDKTLVDRPKPFARQSQEVAQGTPFKRHPPIHIGFTERQRRIEQQTKRQGAVMNSKRNVGNRSLIAKTMRATSRIDDRDVSDADHRTQQTRKNENRIFRPQFRKDNCQHGYLLLPTFPLPWRSGLRKFLFVFCGVGILRREQCGKAKAHKRA